MSRRIAFVSLLVGAIAAPVSATVLYDATGGALPTAAPWAWSLLGAGASVSGPSGGSVFSHFDSTPNLLGQEGWLQISPLALDNSTGYDVTFDLRINAENHTSNDRAGLEVIVLGADHHGVELSFWANQIWNQNDTPLFTHGEGAAYDTTAAGSGIGGLRHYNLHVSGGNYTLSAEGSALFGGAIRDYSAFSGTPNPYSTNNFLWVGDDTKEGSANADFSYFEVKVTPEPETLAALALGVLIVSGRRRARKID